MSERPVVVLTIAGFDPSSGAGVTADIKTIAAHGCYGVACISALTVQSTAGVKRVSPVNAMLVAETLEEIEMDISVGAVHIGMLGSAEVVRAVATFLKKAKLPNIVLDPVLKSSSGSPLLSAEGTRELIEKLLPLAQVITPNIDEAAALTGVEVSTPGEMREAAARLHEMGAMAVVVTGGHLKKAIDLISYKSARGIQQEVFTTDKVQSNSTHGTGCAYSTSMACHLALGRGLVEAALLAKTYVTAAIAAGLTLGRGTGPVNHLYRMGERRRSV